jgi:hypothetical protein
VKSSRSLEGEVRCGEGRKEKEEEEKKERGEVEGRGRRVDGGWEGGDESVREGGVLRQK